MAAGKPTIRDVASAAGVSIKTVSRVLNKERYVAADKRARVEEAVAALRFRPSHAARALAGRRSFQIALLYDNHSAYYIHEVQTGVWERCRAEGVRMLAQPTDIAAPTIVADVAGLIDQTHVDGVILSSPVTDCAAVLDELERRGVPYARISPGTDPGRAPSVSMDDTRAAADMTMHLIALGHRRIGFVVGHSGHGASRERLAGYRAALARAGIAFDAALVRPGAFDFASGEAAADALLDLPVPPTAIFASNDDMAAGVLTVAHRRGLALPGRLSVAGFDDTALARQLWPPLTTVRQPSRALAHAAADLLFAGGDAPVHRRLAHEIVVRGSTAPPAPAASRR